MTFQAAPSSIAALAFRWIVGGIFIVAGVLKIIAPAQFAGSIANYRMLPHEWINLMAITLPWIEVSAGLMLIAGMWLRASALVVTGMTVMFFFAISTALARGLNIECGCFGTVGGRAVGLKSLAMDMGLMFMAAWLAWRSPD